MLEYFSEIEIEHLRALKANLSVKPKDYFFHRIENFDEFRQINASMWLWQWRYLYSGLTLVVETFKELVNAVSSLLTLHFSVAEEHFYKAPKAALAVLAKLTLDIGLLCLHLTRLTTLLIATFFPQLTWLSLTAASYAMTFLSYPVLGTPGLVIGLGAYTLCASLFIQSVTHEKPKKYKRQSNWRQELEDFDSLLDQVISDRQQIRQVLNQAIEEENMEFSKLPQLDKSPGKQQRFFSDPAKLKKDYRLLKGASETTKEMKETIAQLSLALESYPDFCSKLAVSDPHYISQIYKDTAEHHATVLALAKEVLGLIENLGHQRKGISENRTESQFSYQ
ncbi:MULTISPECIES: hypothetical protein [unclassified Legionella]|uniref:hypothetical protein n=1 Tax=unclassified Legionella TaxID=2622702 RepID=UPI001E51BEDB|nr:hypothetical protein [Legionella sp. 31fI33]MCC5014279.1 hypothetical protein [Legionella sp. 31fI33]